MSIASEDCVELRDSRTSFFRTGLASIRLRQLMQLELDRVPCVALRLRLEFFIRTLQVYAHVDVCWRDEQLLSLNRKQTRLERRLQSGYLTCRMGVSGEESPIWAMQPSHQSLLRHSLEGRRQTAPSKPSRTDSLPAVLLRL